MGNCLQILFFWLQRAPPVAAAAVDTNVPNKVSINCACFNSKVVDDTDSSSNHEEETKNIADKVEEFFSFG